jgi:glycosyltransferase involved in cell wall biosynthesis
MATLYINGKFLGAGLNGVHRTAAQYSSQLIEHAGRAGHTVRLVTPRAVPSDPAFPLLQPEVVKGRFGSGQGWEMLTLPRVARGHLLVNFCNLAPMLHGNSVVMIHDAQTFLYPADYTGRQAAAYRLLLPRIGARARRILTVSEFSRRSLAQHGVGRLDKIDVVHNGTDHILDTPAEPGILGDLGVTAGRYVMVVGSSKGYKNIARVFAAMDHPDLRDVPLVVAGGPGAEAYAARGWAIPKNARFSGFIPDGALRALYEGAAVFAFPSLTEGFGLPPIEAMHCGAPVVAARAGAMPEVCGDAALLVDPDETGAWQDALRRVLSDPDLAADLRTRGTARAATLSWQAAGDRLWSLLEPLLPGDA